MVDSMLDYSPDFVVNWNAIMAGQRPHILRDECLAVGFYQLLHMMSLQALPTKIACMIVHCTELKDICLSQCVGFVAGLD